jgi:predicted nucleic acid-binding protein
VHKIRVYVDTSVFGGTQDEEFFVESNNFFDHVRLGEYKVLLSDETQRELANSPDVVQDVWQNLPPGSVELISIDDEARFLANEYITAKVLGEASIGDALHVAVATVAGADLILSWNFKHIVNFSRIRGFNGVNVRMGYRAMTILSPKEVGDEEENI